MNYREFCVEFRHSSVELTKSQFCKKKIDIFERETIEPVLYTVSKSYICKQNDQ